MPYLINEFTCALIPEGSKTRIIENSNILLVNEALSFVIAHNCIYNGSSLKGRQKGSAFLLKTRYKVPIILNEKKEIILLPTHSSRNAECIWVVNQNIENYYPTPSNHVLLEFKNKQKIELNVSYKIFNNQVLKASRLESILRGRNNQKYL